MAKLFLEKGEGERVRSITISHFHEFNKCAGSAKIFLNEKSTPIGTLSSIIVAVQLNPIMFKKSCKAF